MTLMMGNTSKGCSNKGVFERVIELDLQEILMDDSKIGIQPKKDSIRRLQAELLRNTKSVLFFLWLILHL
jgi:hypothetical protein